MSFGPAMRRIRSQILTLIAVVFAATALTFAVTEILPGDAAVAILGDTATEADIQSLRQELGLERPLVVRYADWLGNAITGDLGRSYRTRESIAVMIGQRLPVTIELIILTQIIALGLAVPAGIIAAYRNRSGVDHALGSVSIGLLSMPAFVIGIGLIYTLSVALGWFPASGYVRPSDGIIANLHSMVLPALTLALAEFPVYMRLLRADMIATLQQDFILVARAKGLGVRDILIGHALRPSSLSLVTVIGINLGRLVGGAVIIETLFAIPGIGQMLVNAVYQHDHFAIQGVVLVVATGFVLINLAVDMAYALLDPRVRHGVDS
ncbi:ABC transporter permease [Afipia sp. P52-10]|uniref:ABC transporter permease n=1 Tax=Afipia sp. P52-10 TaxID=1429916 RepID=UPI0004B88ABD|nr:ABC transporter permease [Afipia sp. P52-10]